MTKAITITSIVTTLLAIKLNTNVLEKIAKLTTTLPIISSTYKTILTNNTDVKIIQET